METTIKLSPAELTYDIFKKLQLITKNSDELEIFIRTREKSKFKSEVLEAVGEIEKDENLVKFSDEEFEAFTNKLLNES